MHAGLLKCSLNTLDLSCHMNYSESSPYYLETVHMHPHPIRFSFDETKATQAAALLLRRAGNKMSYMALIKLLYFADREALKENERPITGDRYYSLKYGPVLSRVKNLITEEEATRESQFWSKHISAPSEYEVSLISDPGNGELCQLEEDILNEIFEQYGRMDRFKLAELTHQICEEWDAPAENGPGATPINIEKILKAVGKSAKEIESLREELRAEQILQVVITD